MILIKSALLLSVLLILLPFSSADADTDADLVIEVFRHGARGALVNTYDPDSYWRNNLGELTSGGMRMHYLLGTALKKKYPKLLKTYDPVNIYVRSTDVNRTIMSAYSQLSGVFEGDGPNIITEVAELALPAYQHDSIKDKVKELNNAYALPNKFQAVPIHVVPKTEDILMRPFDACKKQPDWVIENQKSEVVTSIFNNEMKELVAHLKSKNINIDAMAKLSYVGDTCITNKFQGLPLPGGISVDSQLFKDAKFAAEYMTVKQIEGTAVQRALFSTPILTEIKKYVDNFKTAPATNPKFVFLSAHDTTLMTILAAFNITTPECLLENYRSEKAGKGLVYPNCVFPQYASNVIFEYNSKKDEINFLYNGLSIPICHKEGSTQCSYTNFKTYVSEVTNKTAMDTFMKTCGLNKDDSSNHGKKNTTGFTTLEGFLIPISSILFMSLVGTCILFRKKQVNRLKRTLSAESLLTEV